MRYEEPELRILLMNVENVICESLDNGVVIDPINPVPGLGQDENDY